MKKYQLSAAALAVAFSMFTAPLTAAAEAESSGYPFKTTSSYYYDRFDLDAQLLYNNLVTSARFVDESPKTFIEVPRAYYTGLTDDQVSDVVWIFLYDHPEYFWAANHFSVSNSWEGSSVILDVYAEYQDGAKRQAARQELIDTAQDYIAGAEQYDTDYDRAKYLSDRLHSEITYQQGSIDQSVASALLQKTTVCAGFSKAYSMLANAVGVDTITLQSPDHAWNVTTIADVWYHNDVTNHLFLYSDEEMHSFDDSASKTKVTYSDGSTKVFGMHDIERDYYTELYPECPQHYDGSSRSVSGDPVATTEPIETTDTTTTTTTTTSATTTTTTTYTTTTTTTTTTFMTTTPSTTTTRSTTTTPLTTTTRSTTTTPSTTTTRSTTTTPSTTTTRSTTTTPSTTTTRSTTTTPSTTTTRSTTTTPSTTTTASTTPSADEPAESVLISPTEPASTQPPSGTNLKYYGVDPTDAFYFAEDTTPFDLSKLADTLWEIEESWEGYSHSVSKTSVTNGISSLRCYSGLESPAQVMAAIESTSDYHYYVGKLPVSYNGDQVDIRNIYVVRRGDFDGNGVTNAVDAAGVLVYAASVGSGSMPELPSGVNQRAALFAAKLTDDSSSVNAADAAEILLLSAKLGAGEVG